jgi:hypothetical protein
MPRELNNYCAWSWFQIFIMDRNLFDLSELVLEVHGIRERCYFIECFITKSKINCIVYIILIT